MDRKQSENINLIENWNICNGIQKQTAKKKNKKESKESEKEQ